MRAGDYRVIYVYDDKVVQVLSLRRRSEDTYDHLDEPEVRQFEEFRVGRPEKSDDQRVADWEELAKRWAAPKTETEEARVDGWHRLTKENACCAMRFGWDLPHQLSPGISPRAATIR